MRYAARYYAFLVSCLILCLQCFHNRNFIGKDDCITWQMLNSTSFYCCIFTWLDTAGFPHSFSPRILFTRYFLHLSFLFRFFPIYCFAFCRFSRPFFLLNFLLILPPHFIFPFDFRFHSLIFSKIVPFVFSFICQPWLDRLILALEIVWMIFSHFLEQNHRICVKYNYRSQFNHRSKTSISN